MQTVFSSSEGFLPFGGTARPAGIAPAFGPSWSNTGDWSFDAASGEVVGAGSNGFYYVTIPTVAGHTYTMTVHTRVATSGGLSVYYDNDGTSDLAMDASAEGIAQITFTAHTSNYQVSIKGYNFTGRIAWQQTTPQ